MWNNHEYCNTSDLGLKINMACALGMPSLNVLQQGANWSSAQIRRGRVSSEEENSNRLRWSISGFIVELESVPKKKSALMLMQVFVGL